MKKIEYESETVAFAGYLSGVYDYYGEVYYFKRESLIITLLIERGLGEGDYIYINSIAYVAYWDNNAECYRLSVDVSDYAHADMDHLSIEIRQHVMRLNIKPHDGICPLNISMPPYPLNPYIFYGQSNLLVLPPSFVYISPLFFNLPLDAEEVAYMNRVLPLEAYNDVLFFDRLQRPAHTANGAGMSQSRPRNFWKTTDYIYLDACDDCILLQWQSLAGNPKGAIWRVKGRTIAENGKTEYKGGGNGYVIKRDMSESLTAYIEGLSAYDYAYFADIVTSVEVYALRDRSEALLLDSPFWDSIKGNYAVEVATKKITIPDGDAKIYTLEVEIKYKKYGGQL